MATSSSLNIDMSPRKQAVSNYIIWTERAPGLPPSSSNAQYRRQATGGSPPYVYKSSVPEVAIVDQQGNVTATGNGSSLISVTDQLNRNVHYHIEFSGVRLVYLVENAYWDSNAQHPLRPDLNALSINEIRQFWNQYQGESDPFGSVPSLLKWPAGNYWSSNNATGNNAYAVNLSVATPNFAQIPTAGGTVLPALFKSNG